MTTSTTIERKTVTRALTGAAVQFDDDPFALSRAARQRLESTEGGPMFLNDWVRSLFIHYEVPAERLQVEVPFELDLYKGKAYVSLVAFFIKHLRPSVGGRITEWLSAPVSNHGFLNVRTYVKHDDEPGIYFLSEWLPNRLSVFIGPRTFGLPYRYGKLDYDHDHEHGCVRGSVAPVPNPLLHSLEYKATFDTNIDYQPCASATRDAFLLERYTAYTFRRGVRRRFRIAHDPWPQARVDVEVHDRGLLAQSGDWIHHARLVGGNYTPGVRDIWIGKPACVNGKHCDRVWHTV